MLPIGHLYAVFIPFGPLAVDVGADGGEENRGACAYAHADNHGDGNLIADNTGDGKSLQNADGGGATLNYCGDDNTHKYCNKRIGNGGDEAEEGRTFLQRSHCAAH